ncbi:MAG: GspH/FimT family protein [Proteobacteria bacterium]|nr:GspH/FimT family protein [Pseudomonadota bacterium]MBU1058345.1 GspH/FimT family protein [Pseudomonadota bacterium]
MKKNNGFSLVELIIILVIIGILAALATPTINTLGPGFRLKGVARGLYSDLQKAKMQAVKENQPVSVRFVAGVMPNSGYYYFDLNDDTLYNVGEYQVILSNPKDVDFGNGTATNDWNNTLIVPGPVAAITFAADGTANSASIYLENKNNDICYALTSQVSGSIKLRKYSGAVPFDITQWN